MEKNNPSKNQNVDSKANLRLNSKRWRFGWYLLLILVPAAFIGPIVALFIKLYFAAPDFQLFLILAVLGIIFYVSIEVILLKELDMAQDPNRNPDVVIRIKGREYSFWGILLFASIGVLLTYYLIVVVTLLFDRFVHNDLSWKVLDTICSSKVFWWVTSICLFVFAASWAIKEMEVKNALSKSRRPDDDNLGATLFPEVGQIMPLKSIRVFQVFSDGSALAYTSDKAPADPVIDYKGPTVHLFADENNPYYDDLVITVTEDKVIRQVGIYRYGSKYGVKTVPIISILDKQSDDC